jgi:indole-3-glycerol phosphate synthase
MERALAIPGCAVGVNSRNLETLEVDPAVGERLIPIVPADRVAVYESGVATVADVARAAAVGADAVLVGSVLSPAADGSAAVRGLCGVSRRRRG